MAEALAYRAFRAHGKLLSLDEMQAVSGLNFDILLMEYLGGIMDLTGACQKSLDAAIRSKRANIAEALRAKLTKLKAERSPKSCETKRVPRKKKHAAVENASEDSKTSKVKKAKNVKKVLKKNPSKQKCTLDDAKIDAVLFPDTTSTLKTVKHGSKSTKREPARETPKRKKVKRKTQGSSGELPSDARATAIDLLLRAAAKAKAARQAAGEESEEEAPMPELPTPRKNFAAGGFFACEEEPQAETPRAQAAADEDDDFFDAVEDSLPAVPTEVEAPRSERGVARREKKMRRKERLERMRQERLQKHPSWVAAKSPRVNGEVGRLAIRSAGQGRDGKEAIEGCLTCVEAVYDGVSILPYLPGSLAKKIGPLKGTLNKIEQVLYELALLSEGSSFDPSLLDTIEIEN
eukprot:symbB.v1.2.015702.t3/scaffold1180.1/size133432/11